MTSNEYIAALEHKQERWEEVARDKEETKVDLEITRNWKVEENKIKKEEDKKLRAEEHAEEHRVMWSPKWCTKAWAK